MSLAPFRVATGDVASTERRLATENHLIQKLPRQERRDLLSICEPVVLKLADTLYDVGTTTRYVYFPIDGFISLLTEVDERSVLEVGMVGREGMLGVHVALGLMRSPMRALVQGPGTAWRVPVGPFRKALAANNLLQRRLDHYVSVLMAQLASSAACVRYHLIGPRLARWLLMSQDRARADRFFMTQDFLSYMLGVRRVGVTVAAGKLQRRGLIAYRRGEIEVIDRAGLEAVACSCYASDRTLYASLVH